jgi:hypothetical protein
MYWMTLFWRRGLGTEGAIDLGWVLEEVSGGCRVQTLGAVGVCWRAGGLAGGRWCDRNQKRK